MSKVFSIKELVAKGYTMEQIVALKAKYDRDQEELAIQTAREEARALASAMASAKYYADKEAHGAKCITCGCTLTVANTSGYCQRHVSKAVLGLSEQEVALRLAAKKAEKKERKARTKYVSITFYGIKGNDLMDHRYYQGGSVSPR